MGSNKEKEFFDNSYKTNVREPLWKYYAIVKRSHDHYRDLLNELCPDKRVLEYGCGRGTYAMPLAKKRAEVVGIDISESAIVQARELAKREGLDNTEFFEMDAQEMTFEDSSFDLICGSGILHHLELDRAVPEIVRVLKPGGKAIFMEPLGHNPALNLFRKMTPKMRSDDEHPLKKNDLALLDQHFGETEYIFYHLASFFSIPFLKTKLFFPMLKAFDNLDQAMFKVIPGIRPMAWYVLIVLSAPKAS